MNRLMAVLVLVLLSDCSSGTSECGSSGDCGAGFNCTDLTCTACGAVGQQCCNPPGALEPSCTGALTCLEGMPRRCAACGGAGQACCTGDDTTRPCNAGFACASGVCASGPSLCAAGASHRVGVVDRAECGVRVVTATGATFEDAKRCAETMLRAGELVRHDPPPASGLVEYDVCVTRRGMRTPPFPLQAFSDGDARLCACGGPEMTLGCLVRFNCTE
jgi:hypothetical protein